VGLHHALLLCPGAYYSGVILDNSLGTSSPQIQNQKNQNNIINQCPIEFHWFIVHLSHAQSKIMMWGFSGI